MILSPHFDDAVLSCWQLLDGPDEVTVLNVFTASPPAGTPAGWWDVATGAMDSVERMSERRQEDAAALTLADRLSVQLGLLDDQYRDSPVSVDDVARRIGLRAMPPAILHAPGAFDGHSDHVLVRDAALKFARVGWPVVLYADLPHATSRGWPAWLSGEQSSVGTEVAANWHRVLSQAGLVVQNLDCRVYPLDAPARARKLQVLSAYKTQRAGLNRYGCVPLDDPRALAWEVSWVVRASALGSPQELSGEAVVADFARQPLDDRV